MNSALPHNLPLDLADADGDAGQAVAGRAVESSVPQARYGPGDVPLNLVRVAAFGTGSRAWKVYNRFVETIADRVTRHGDGIERMPGDVVVDRGPNAGRTVGELMQQRPTPLPDEVKHGTDRQRRREFLNRTIRDDYDRFCEQQRLARTGPESAKKYNQERGTWLNELFVREGMRVGTGRNALIEKAKRVARGEATDGRSRSGRRPAVLFDPEIFEQCLALHTTSGMDLTGAHSIFAWGEVRGAKLGANGRGVSSALANSSPSASREPSG